MIESPEGKPKHPPHPMAVKVGRIVGNLASLVVVITSAFAITSGHRGATLTVLWISLTLNAVYLVRSAGK